MSCVFAGNIMFYPYPALTERLFSVDTYFIWEFESKQTAFVQKDGTLSEYAVQSQICSLGRHQTLKSECFAAWCCHLRPIRDRSGLQAGQ